MNVTRNNINIPVTRNISMKIKQILTDIIQGFLMTMTLGGIRNWSERFNRWFETQ